MHSNNVKLKNDLKVIRFFARPASRGNLLSRGPQAQHMFEIRSFNSEHVRNSPPVRFNETSQSDKAAKRRPP